METASGDGVAAKRSLGVGPVVQALLTTQLESGNWRKKNRDLAPELVAYTLTLSFSHASHQCGHDSLSPITVDMGCSSGDPGRGSFIPVTNFLKVCS